MGKYIMALDQGTTSSRCILFDKNGNMCSVAQKEYKQYYPKPGWVEHDPSEIWSSQMSVATEAMSKIGVTADNGAAIGIILCVCVVIVFSICNKLIKDDDLEF